MRLLLDTHVFLWMHAEPERLSGETRKLLSDARTEIFLSVVVPWEIGIKLAKKRLRLPEPLDGYVTSRMRRAGMKALGIELSHVLDASALPRHHDDPFDRMLLAQARIERLPLLTADETLSRYEAPLVPA